jgi:hypothetical protein
MAQLCMRLINMILDTSHLPSHNHHLNAATTLIDVGGSLSGKALRGLSNLLALPVYFATSTISSALATESMLSTGIGLSHENRHPYVQMGSVLYCSEQCSTNLVVSGCGCDLVSGNCKVVVSGNETITPTSVVNSNLEITPIGSIQVDVFGSSVLLVQKKATLAGTVCNFLFSVQMYAYIAK